MENRNEHEKSLLPVDKFDTAAAERLSKEPSEKVIPLLPELMEWLQDMNWPVSEAVLKTVVKYEDQTTPMALEILNPEQKDDMWKYWIITEFVPALSDRNRHLLLDEIKRIACHPTNGEQEEAADKAAKELLSSITYDPAVCKNNGRCRRSRRVL